MNDSFASLDLLRIELRHNHGRGVVAVTFDPVFANSDSTDIDEWLPVAVRRVSGQPLTSTVLRSLPMGHLAAVALERFPALWDETPTTIDVSLPVTTQDKIEAAARAWHDAKAGHGKVTVLVQRALGGLSEARVAHYVRLARQQGLIPESGRRGPKPKGAQR